MLHGDCITITGSTIAEELKDVPSKPRADQKVIYPIDQALYDEGHLAILKGNLAPDGAVAKITGLKNPVITGPARVFEDEQSAMDAILADKIKAGDVVVLRYLGPKGGPGMPRDAGADFRDHRQGTRRIGRPDHRRPFLRRHVGHGGRPRRAGSVRRRHDRRSCRKATRSPSTRTSCCSN